jgi:hypothetical protein
MFLDRRTPFDHMVVTPAISRAASMAHMALINETMHEMGPDPTLRVRKSREAVDTTQISVDQTLWLRVMEEPVLAMMKRSYSWDVQADNPSNKGSIRYRLAFILDDGIWQQPRICEYNSVDCFPEVTRTDWDNIQTLPKKDVERLSPKEYDNVVDQEVSLGLNNLPVSLEEYQIVRKAMENVVVIPDH